jgi:hypothetical protein
MTMASRNSSRIQRSRRSLGSPRRKRRSLLPLLETLEHRLVLSVRPPIVPPGLAGLATAGDASRLAVHDGLVPVTLADGGTAWLEATGTSGPRLPSISGSSTGVTPPSGRPIRSDPGAILGHLPVSSPFETAVPQSATGPAGYIPQQIQAAYGLSDGRGYNNNVSFGAIKGDGTGQTIGIYEEGYSPAFVNSSDRSYGASALAIFDRTFDLP